MNVVLVGYRGAGKSAAAALLGPRLGMKVVSLDEQIQRRAGKRIPEIVAESGWDAFRDLEEQVVREVAAGDGQIIDCGGGVVEREANVAPLRAAGPVFWLTASPATIVRRIQDDDQRPSLTGAKSFTEEVEEVLQRREPLYRRLCHFIVDTDRLTVQQVADHIAQAVAPPDRRRTSAGV